MAGLRERSATSARRQDKRPGMLRKRRPKRASQTGKPASPSLKLQIDLAVGSRLGPGKIKLLEMIDSEGSLSRGAQRMGISYRRAWLFVQQINRAFDEKVVATPEAGQGGAAARVTGFGRELVQRYRELEVTAGRTAAKTLRWLANHTARE